MDKQIRTPETITPDRYNTYYMRVAQKYRVAKWVLLLVFTLYLILTLTINRENITHENLMYLLRDFNVSAASDGGFTSVVYEERQNRSFSSFKGELVVAGVSEISFYNAAGARTLYETTACVSPVVEVGEKYLLLYDAGGTAYSIYTTLAAVSFGETESPIQCAAMSDSGVYAIASRAQDSKYTVTLYSDSFREIARYYRDTYVTDIAVSKSGEQLAILSVVSAHSSLDGVLTLCKAGTTDTMDIPLGKTLPLCVSYLSDGTLAVVTDGGVHLYDRDGTEKSVFSFDDTMLTAMDFSASRVVVACREDTLGSTSRIYVISSDGTVLSETATSEKITAVYASDGVRTAYVSDQNSVWYTDASGALTKMASYTGNLLSLCEIGGVPVFCFSSGAQTALPAEQTNH